MSRMFRTEQLRYTQPQAFAALPEPYQEDDWLMFYIDINGNLNAVPDEVNVAILGDWEMMFDANSNEWVTTS